jgi:hypothetical protein
LKTKTLQLLAVVGILAVAGSTRAGIVTYKFTGSVQEFVDYGSILPSDIGVGNTASGTFSYDDGATGPNFYRGTQVQMSETVTVVTSKNNTYTFSLTTPVGGDEIDLFDDFFGKSFGFYKRGPDEALGFGNDAHVNFLDAFGFGSTSNDLYQTNVSLTVFSTIGISDPGYANYYYIGVTCETLENVTTPAVPEPGSLMLCGMGALALVGYGWRRRRTAS